MRVRVNNNKVPDLWLKQEQDFARGNGNIYFQDNVIYSYGEHFPIAAIVQNKKGEEAILLTIDTYSPTTAQHISSVRSVLFRDPKRRPVFHLPLSWMRRRGVEFDERMDEWWPLYQNRIDEKMDKAKRARKHKLRPLQEAQSIRDEAKAFSRFWSLRKRLKVPRNLDAMIEAEEAKRERQHKESELDKKSRREQWRKGHRLIENSHPTMLRMGKNGVEVSSGATIPLDLARSIFQRAVTARKLRTAWSAPSHRWSGDAVLYDIDHNGSCCTKWGFLTYDEIRPIAEALNLTSNP